MAETQESAAVRYAKLHEDAALAVTWMDTTAVVPYVHNPRKVPDTAIAKVAASLQRYGWRQPIVLDRNLVVIAGHTRLAAAKRLGLTRVPVHVADDLDVAEVQAYRLADNRSNEDTSWDEEFLRLELIELQGFDFPLELTAFDAKELRLLVGDVVLEAARDPNGMGDHTKTGQQANECPKCGYRW